MGLLVNITIGLSAIGSILALILMAIYVKSYRKVRARFVLSLMFVALFFFLQNSLMVYAFYTMMADFTDLVLRLMILTTAFGDIALGLLLWNSMK
jgi:hypothetical protein